MTHTMADKRDGRDACKGINSSLVSIKSSDQQEFILQEITDTFGVDETVMLFNVCSSKRMSSCSLLVFSLTWLLPWGVDCSV